MQSMMDVLLILVGGPSISRNWSDHESSALLWAWIPFPVEEVVQQYLSDNSTDFLYLSNSDVNWILYNKLHVGNYRKVRHAKISDLVVPRVNTQETAYTHAIMNKWLIGQFDLDKAHIKPILHK